MTPRPVNNRFPFLTTAFCAVVLLASNVPGQDASIPPNHDLPPQLQVLVRMDRNQDGVLESGEILQQARPFVDNVVHKFKQDSPQGLTRFRLPGSDSIDLSALMRASATRIPPSLDPDHPPIPTATKEERFPQYAWTLVSQYDQDRDGVLSPDEYQRLGNRFSKWDLNLDGAISSAEISVRFRTLKELDGQNNLKTNSDVEKPKTFKELDINHDGQVQMHEYSHDWNNQTILSFQEKDLNQDGIITLREWLQHQVANETNSEHPRDLQKESK